MTSNFESYSPQGLLTLQGQPLLDWIRTHHIDQPTYLYSIPGLKSRLRNFRELLHQKLSQNLSFHFAIKSNPYHELLEQIRADGFGIDIVSGGELERALEVGFKGADIVFSGVGKSKQEIRRALDVGVLQFNVESLAELQRIAELAQAAQKMATIILRLNPNVDAKTHPYIATGIFDNKFGMNEDQFVEAMNIFKNSSHLQWRGLSCHIGSQILDISVFRESLQFQRRIFEAYRALGFDLTVFNVGGGLGINYQESEPDDLPRLHQYAELIGQELAGLDANIQFEPGRFLVARYGMLLTQVEYLKKTTHKNFLICNSGMNHLLRPALYAAKHRILPLVQRSGPWSHYDVVGPVCESSDFFAKNLYLSPVQEGDWLAIMDAGAYGASMASQYNLFQLPKEICIY